MGRILLLALFFVVGCGPIRVTVGLVDAERAVQEAKDAGAAEHAKYPLTLAEELLSKAVEEKGYAEWEQSFILANEAVLRANEAADLARTAVAEGAAPLWPELSEPAEEPTPEAPPAQEPAAEEPPAQDEAAEPDLLDDSELSDDLWGNKPEEAEEPTPADADEDEDPEEGEPIDAEDEELLEGIEDKKKEEKEPARKSRKVE
jgi:hypothetical protein